MTLQLSSQPIGTRRYTVDTLDSIRSAIAAYAGGPAIVRELVQNADDARAEWLEFHFTPQKLIVKNSSIFRPQDFDAICRIGSGSKRADQDTIGTWGTGFISVYQITDYPEILSTGRRLQINPTGQDFPEYPSEVLNHTEFHFSWRKVQSEISERIDADIWTPERIVQFLVEIGPEIYRAMPFLRNLSRITVYDYLTQGTFRKLFEVRTDSREKSRGQAYERRTFTLYNALQEAKPERKDTWHFFRGKLAEGDFVYKGRAIKSAEYAIALGPADSGMGGDFPGVVYNYLPTEIDTGFNFHINGDFFPDANRKSILKGDGSEKSRWNEQLIQSIAVLFASNLERLRDLSPSPTAFYRLLPINSNPRYNFLQPIVNTFRDKARFAPIVYTTDGKWALPIEARSVDNPKFRRLVEDCMPGIVARNFPATLQQFLQPLGLKALTLVDYLNFLKTSIPDGSELESSSPVVGSRERLYHIYNYFYNLPPEEKNLLLEMLNGVPLCLDETGKLYAFGSHAIWLADDEARNLLPPGSCWLVDLDIQKKYPQLLQHKLQTFTVLQMVEYLKQLAPLCEGQPITHAPLAVNSRLKLRNICNYLARHNVFSAYGNDLTGLPLGVDEKHNLRLISNDIFLANAEARSILLEAGLVFISPEIEKDEFLSQFLQRGGVSRVSPSYMTILLERFSRERVELPFASPLFNSLDKLLHLYQYFRIHTSELSELDLERLRQLPIFLAQDETLASLASDNGSLFLPPMADQSQFEDFGDIMRLELLLSEKVLDDEIRPFFKKVLKVPELSPLDYISNYIVPRYSSLGLNDGEKFHLLNMILKFYPQIRHYSQQGEQGAKLIKLLQQVPLIRCSDGQYRRPGQVYFPSEFLENIFPMGYNRPHDCYKIQPIVKSKRDQSELVISRWHNLFTDLKMRSEPDAEDLMISVKLTVKGPPLAAAREHIRQIYELLNEHWEEYSFDAAVLTDLNQIAWLPADGDETHWYKPCELYPSTYKALIWSRQKVLPFRQANRNFSDFLRLNVLPRVEDVVDHLLYLCREKKPVVDAIYDYLYRQAGQDKAIEKLKGQPIIYVQSGESAQFWKPEKCFIGNYHGEFGEYRFYFKNEQDNFAGLFKRLGTKVQPDPVQDYVDLLAEISEAHFSITLDDQDRYLVNNAYVRLAQALSHTPGSSTVPGWLHQLKTRPIVINAFDHKLYRPDEIFLKDRGELLEKFEPGTIPLAHFSDIKAQLLLSELGVRPLSQVVSRKKLRLESSGQSGFDNAFLRARIPQLQRIIAYYRKEHPAGWRDLDWLNQIQVKKASVIEIQYIFNGFQKPLTGKTEDQEVFYDLENAAHVLYIQEKADKAASLLPMALELASLLNPAYDRAKLAPLLQQLLSCEPGAKAHKLLDSYEIARLANSEEEIERPGQDTRSGARVGTQGNTSSSEPRSQPTEVTNNWPDGENGTGLSERNKKPTANVNKGPATRPVPKPFKGKTRPEVPVKGTNWTGLEKRFGSIAQEKANQSELGEAENEYDSSAKEGQTYWELEEEDIIPAHERIEEVRFGLSYMMRYEGFLPLTNKSLALLKDQATEILCRTEYGEQIQEFPLYIDRENKVVHNSEALPKFFAAQNIPAGGIVYLRHVLDHTFRLYYNRVTHTVDNVRIAFMEDDKLVYEEIPSVEVPCEIAEFVFKADKRLEDTEALFAEAKGKKSVFETLVDIFDALPADIVLHQDALFNALFNIRMVSRYTVNAELRRRPCFVDHGSGNWSFDPTRVLQNPVRRPAVTGPQKPGVSKPVSTGNESKYRPDPDTRLGGSNNPAEPVFPRVPSTPEHFGMWFDTLLEGFKLLKNEPKQLKEVLLHIKDSYLQFTGGIETYYRTTIDVVPPIGQPGGIFEQNVLGLARYYLGILKDEPNNREAGESYEGILKELFKRTFANETEAESTLRTVLENSDSLTWQLRVRPLIDRLVKELEQNYDYNQVEILLQLDESLSGVSRATDLDRLQKLKKAYEFYELARAGNEPVEDELLYLLEALQLDSSLKEARKLLDGRVLAYLSADFKEVKLLASEVKFEEAVTGFERIKNQVEFYQPKMYNGRLLEPDLNNLRQHILKCARLQLEKKDSKSSGLINLAIARLYLCISPGGVQREYGAGYFNALVAAGKCFSSDNQPNVAAILLGRAIQSKDRAITGSATINTDQVIEARQLLAQIYEELELWDYSHKQRRELVTVCTDKIKDKEQIKLSEAENRRGEQMHLNAAHLRFLNWLQQCRIEFPSLTAAVGEDYFNSLIKEEQRFLAYAG
ncbi:MAG TPA: hypothetical protein VH186_08355 [Chloroflexia bacterium]|nr:hypothetical protein [Chloroflexia bacterium]